MRKILSLYVASSNWNNNTHSSSYLWEVRNFKMDLPFIIWISSAENWGRRFGTFCWLDLNRTRSFITIGQSPVSEYIGWANQPRSKFIALYAASRSVATAELFAFEYPQFSVIPHLPAIDKPCHRMWATRSYLRNCQILCTICMHRPYNHFVTMKIMCSPAVWPLEGEQLQCRQNWSNLI